MLRRGGPNGLPLSPSLVKPPNMSRHSSRLSLPVATLPLFLLGACADAIPTAATPAASLSRAPVAEFTGTTSVIMTGLNAPKQLAFGPEGALYVAETGTGAASGSCIPAGDTD